MKIFCPRAFKSRPRLLEYSCRSCLLNALCANTRRHEVVTASQYNFYNGLESLLMRSPFSPDAPAGSEVRVNVKSLVKDTVIDALSLEPSDFDWQRSLAEMGCDSLNVIDIQFDLEKKLGVSNLGLGGPIGFDPVKAPLNQLAQHIRRVLRPV